MDERDLEDDDEIVCLHSLLRLRESPYCVLSTMLSTSSRVRHDRVRREK